MPVTGVRANNRRSSEWFTIILIPMAKVGRISIPSKTSALICAKCANYLVFMILYTLLSTNTIITELLSQVRFLQTIPFTLDV